MLHPRKGVLVEVLQEPFSASFRHRTRKSQRWMKAHYKLVQDGGKYRLVNTNNGEVLTLFGLHCERLENFDSISLVHTVGGGSRYLILRTKEVKCYVWYDDDIKAFDMNDCAWTYAKKHL